MRTKVMTDEVITSVMNLISEGKKVPEIANILGINKVTIGSFLRTHGIKLNPDKGNVHYFDNIYNAILLLSMMDLLSSFTSLMSTILISTSLPLKVHIL